RTRPSPQKGRGTPHPSLSAKGEEEHGTSPLPTWEGNNALLPPRRADGNNTTSLLPSPRRGGVGGGVTPDAPRGASSHLVIPAKPGIRPSRSYFAIPALGRMPAYAGMTA